MNLSYSSFENRLIALESWNPAHEILQKDLSLSPKPAKLTFCQCMILAITHSRSKNAVGAVNTLEHLSKTYRKQLEKNPETVKKLSEINEKIQKKFVENQHGHLKNKSRRKKIESTCKKINKRLVKLSEEAQKTDKTPKKAKSKTSSKDRLIHKFNKKAKDAPSLSIEEANQLLIWAKEKRLKFGKKDADLQDAHFKLRVAVRGAIFAKRLKENKRDLAALKANFDGKNSKVNKFLKKWEESLSKNKPYGPPKWFHCTGITEINGILSSGVIEYSNKSVYAGAFASTHPERLYGEYCIAMSSNIETDGQDEPPLITAAYLNSKGEKIYIGNPSSPRRKKRALQFKAKDIKIPTIWAGFRKDIPLNKPDKQSNPIGYYSGNNLVLVGQTGNDNYSTWLDGLNPECKKNLKERKISVLKKDDFYELIELVNKTFYCHVPASWKNAGTNSSCTLGEKSCVKIA